MKTKRPQKRYESEAQIHKMIEDAQFTIKSEGHEIDRLDEQRTLDYQWFAANPPDQIKGEASRKLWHCKRDSMNLGAEKLKQLRTHRGTLESKLRLLKEKLAAFNTQAMAFLEDRSVV